MSWFRTTGTHGGRPAWCLSCTTDHSRGHPHRRPVREPAAQPTGPVSFERGHHRREPFVDDVDDRLERGEGGHLIGGQVEDQPQARPRHLPPPPPAAPPPAPGPPP